MTTGPIEPANGVKMLRELADELEAEEKEIRATMMELFDCLDDGVGRQDWSPRYRAVIEKIEKMWRIKYPG